MTTFQPLGEGPVTRERVAPLADYIRRVGRGHREPLHFTTAGGNTRTGKVQAIETDGVRVGGALLRWESLVIVQPVAARLEELRTELRAERISMGELVDLQGLAEYIEPGDVELLEPAGVPEFPPEASAELGPCCPACGSDETDFVNNDEMRCGSCGSSWDNPQEDDG